jgi:hypothetical protein
MTTGPTEAVNHDRPVDRCRIQRNGLGRQLPSTMAEYLSPGAVQIDVNGVTSSQVMDQVLHRWTCIES